MDKTVDLSTSNPESYYSKERTSHIGIKKQIQLLLYGAFQKLILNIDTNRLQAEYGER